MVVLIGQGVCAVKTLTRNHLYCEPPPKQPAPISNGRKREGFDSLPEFMVSISSMKVLTITKCLIRSAHQQAVFQVQMGNLNFSLGKVQYDTIGLSTFPLEAQIGVGVGASIVALIVLVIVLIYRSAGVCVCVCAREQASTKMVEYKKSLIWLYFLRRLRSIDVCTRCDSLCLLWRVPSSWL